MLSTWKPRGYPESNTRLTSWYSATIFRVERPGMLFSKRPCAWRWRPSIRHLAFRNSSSQKRDFASFSGEIWMFTILYVGPLQYVMKCMVWNCWNFWMVLAVSFEAHVCGCVSPSSSLLQAFRGFRRWSKLRSASAHPCGRYLCSVWRELHG